MSSINKNTEFEFRVMQEFGLNAEEWMLAKLLMTKLWSDKDTSIERYYREVIDETITMGVVTSLMSKNVIEPIDLTTIKYINDIYDRVYFTEDFNKFYSSDIFTIGEELWNAFPHYMSGRVNGKAFSARNISKKFDDISDLFVLYAKQIEGRMDIHKEVLNTVNVAKATGKVSCGIAEFVISKQWESWSSLINEEENDAVMLKEFGNDLWNLYPSTINGFPMKNITKVGFHNVESFNKFYFESIGYDKLEHARILDILRRAIDSDLIGFGIYEFVATKKWDDLAKSLDNVKVTEEHMLLFKELYNLYPNTEIIDGNETSLKVITNGYKDFNHIAKDYYEAIARDQDVHEKVIAVTKRAISNGIINMSLSKFIKNRLWISFAK